MRACTQDVPGTLYYLTESSEQVEFTILTFKMEKQRLRKAKVTKQVVQPGTELTCSTILQAQKKMGAKGRAENSELMMELAQKHMAVDEV